jgi:hypothetical protein
MDCIVMAIDKAFQIPWTRTTFFRSQHTDRFVPGDSRPVALSLTVSPTSQAASLKNKEHPLVQELFQ